MLARTASKDEVTAFLKGDVDTIGKDDIVVALESCKQIKGVAVFEGQTTLVHCFELVQDFSLRHAAECLLNYCRGAARAAGFRSAFFIIDADNKPMQRFMEQNGAVREKPGVIYRMDVR